MYKKLAILTIAAVYFLILIGGVVRATGAGMGCPDWPKCFGTWIPPTNIDQLPENYQEIFGAKLKGEVSFNVVKTWTEYINRLVGVLIGILILATAIFSYKDYKKKAPKVVWYSILAFILVGIEGWLGSKVVSTELSPTLITIHMLLAIAIVFCLIYALYLAYEREGVQRLEDQKSNQFILILLLVLSLGQVILGTHVRELVDIASMNGLPRNEWVNTFGGRFYAHIALAVILLISHIWFYINVKSKMEEKFRNVLNFLVLMVIGEFVSGAILGVFNIPAFAQPLHLIMASLIFGAQFFLVLVFSNKEALVRV